jgi:hypothetical protein
MSIASKPTVADFREVVKSCGVDPDSDKGIEILEKAIKDDVIYVPSYAKSPLSNSSQWQHEILTALRDTRVLVKFSISTHEIGFIRKAGEIGMTLNSVGEPVVLSWRYDREAAISWLKANRMDDKEFRARYLELVGFEIPTTD